MRFLLTVSFLFILLQLPQPGAAQVYQKARIITAADGLSDKSVTCFYKDSRGFVWVGTRNGLNRYDGHSFKIFQPAIGNAISNEVINCIAEDSRGRIWVGTMKGLNIYDPATGKWEVMLPDAEKRGVAVPNFIIWDIQIDAQDRVWIVTDVFEFCYYDIRQKKFTYYDWPTFARGHPELNKKRYRSIQKMARKNEHEFWLASNIGLIGLNIQTGAFHYFGGGYRSDVIDLNYNSRNGYVYLTIGGNDLYVYREADSSFRKAELKPQPYPSLQFSMFNQPETWLASENGLIKISSDGKEIHQETNIPQLSTSLLPGSVKDVFEDDRGLRWVGTANGICIYDPAGNRSSFLPLVEASDRESNNRMGGAYYDSVSANYFVCVQDPPVVFVINPYSRKIRKITAGADGEPFSSCNTIKKDRDHTIWLLTSDRVYQWDRLREEFVRFDLPERNKDYLFRDVMKDREGNYWFASFNEGVLFYNGREKKFMPISDSSLSRTRTSTGFAEDTVNGVIVGSSFGEGVWTYHQASGKSTWYHETTKTPDYGQLNLVNGITVDRKGTIWLASYSGGIFRYRPGQVFEKTFVRYDMRDGLSSNNVSSVSSDRDTTLWLLTGKGISAVSNSGKFMFDLDESQTFGFSTYTSDSRFPHDLYYNPDQQELLLGAGGGLFIYSLKKKNSIPRFPVLITSLKLNGKAVFPDSVGDAGLRLPFHSNTLAATFAGLYYGNEQGIRYEYKLENYDTGWIRAAKNYTILYQNLPPGSYRLKVRAVTAGGEVAGEAGELNLRVIPPYWRTWWFITLAVLLMAGILWWIISSLQTKLRVERIINVFATSLYGQNTTEDILWDVARNCIEKLGFADCVIYLRNEKREVLVQTAAYGPKNPHRREIINRLEIPLGRGVVGWVAAQARSLIIKDTSADARYIVDDERRMSEIAVPVIVDQKVFAVIDSEHPQRNFFSAYHLKVLTKVAAICAERVSKYLNEERLRAKIARDLHDEMGSTLTSINIISKVAMEEQKENEKLNSYFSKIKDHSGRMMESMSDMVWAINPVNDNFEKVILKMKEFVAEMLEPARIQFRVEEQGRLETTFLNPEQRRDIYLVLKEAINNIVKYSGATEVLVRLERTDRHLQMEISDNGKGFDAREQRAGNGLKNMQSRAEEMGATLELRTAPGMGTVVLLVLPLTL